MTIDSQPKPLPRAHLVAAIVPATIAFVAYCVVSLARHAHFGSGSWDMGCHVHNLWLLAHPWQPQVSSVLSSPAGDVNFWGGTNHFMPTLLLAVPLAPIVDLGFTGALLVLQALVVALAVVPLALLAHRRQLGPVVVAGVSIAYLFAVGTQTMIDFDVHETAPVPLLTFVALYAFERDRRVVAYVALLLLAGCKESAIVYAAGVGAWLVVTTPRPLLSRRRIEGACIFVFFIALFFFVTAVVQPALIEDGASMIHVARFKALGASPSEIASSVVLHPIDTLARLFSPAPKGQTLAVTAGGFAFLPLLAPEALMLAGPTLAERFLSDKREMWGLGFHYSLPLVGAWAFATVHALGRLRARLASPARVRAFDVVAGVALLVSCVASNMAAPFPPELATVHKQYMANDVDTDRYRRAIAVVPEDAKVVAQNHFLPHLAYRQFIWQPYDVFIDRADFVVLDPKASAWPRTAREMRFLADRLRVDPAWTIVFQEESTVVFKRH